MLLQTAIGRLLVEVSPLSPVTPAVEDPCHCRRVEDVDPPHAHAFCARSQPEVLQRATGYKQVGVEDSLATGNVPTPHDQDRVTLLSPRLRKHASPHRSTIIGLDPKCRWI